jgi:hypothetical protein
MRFTLDSVISGERKEATGSLPKPAMRASSSWDFMAVVLNLMHDMTTG